MGRWDKELVPLLPESVKVFASAGAGYDWADVDVLADHGNLFSGCLSNRSGLSGVIGKLNARRYSVLQRRSSIVRSRRRHCHLPHSQRLPQPQMVSSRSPLGFRRRMARST